MKLKNSLSILPCIVTASVAVSSSLPVQSVEKDKVGATSGATLSSLESIDAARRAQEQAFLKRKAALEKMPPGQNRDALMRQEILKHQAELKRLSMTRAELRGKNIEGLKKEWRKIDSDWKVECTRHDARVKQLENMPAGAQKDAAIAAEKANHLNRSKSLAVKRNAVHEGVLKQANVDAHGGTSTTSAPVKQTAGTRINSPNHRGINGDFDAGGGFRTTEKVEKILQEMGVKGPGGKPVKMKAGVLETAPEFGMTVNAKPGADAVGSAGHQAQTKMSASHKETYISETGGVSSKPLKDHLATLDHSKKAMSGMKENPGSLVGGSPKGQELAKGTIKAAAQADLPPETVTKIAKQRGLKDPESVLDKLAEIKAGRAQIKDADEAAKLQKIAEDILNASQAKTKAKADAYANNTKTKIGELEAAGQRAQANKLRKELTDFKIKSQAASEALAGAETSVGGNTRVSGANKNEPKPATKGSMMKAAGWMLGAYGIYEGYNTAWAEMQTKKEADPTGQMSWGREKAELAAKTLWHGLGFGAASEFGSKAGKEAYEQYKKDIADGKISADSWSSYFGMKSKAVLGGLAGAVNGITFDAAWQSGTSIGEASKEGVGLGKDVMDWIKDSRAEGATNDERSKLIYEKLKEKGASVVGAKRAADAVKRGDYSEAKRLNGILEAKRKEAEEAQEPHPRPKTWLERKRWKEKKLEREKLKQAEVAKTPKKEEEETDEDKKRRETVISVLKARGLPGNDSLIDHLSRILEKDGMEGLESSLKEVAAMQGQFKGSLGGVGKLVLIVRGQTVSGTWVDSVQSGEYTSTVRGQITGMVDILSAKISMTMKRSATVTGGDPKYAKFMPPPKVYTEKMTGSFTGKGYAGKVYSSNGKTGPWSASR